MPERLPTVSVVVPTRGRRDVLPAAVEPLLGDPAASEVVVVLDGSEDGSMEWVESRAAVDPRLRAACTPGLGPGAARDAGVRVASGAVVLLVDDDVIAEPGLVSGHARRHAREEGLLVVGYMPPRVPAARHAGDFALRLYADEYEQACRSYERDPDAVLLGLWGGNVSLRRSDFLRVQERGGEARVRYHEDRDFGLRCRRAGVRPTFDRSLRAVHRHRRDLAGFARDARAQGFGLRVVHERHADVLGRLPGDAFERGLARPLRVLVRAARCRHAGRAVALAATVVTRSAGWARVWRLEERAARLLRRIEQQRGASGTAA
jgi:glycosyltransferase involved in cell wall biosynthesis